MMLFDGLSATVTAPQWTPLLLIWSYLGADAGAPGVDVGGVRML